MKKLVVGEHIVKCYGEGNEKRNVIDGVSIEINEGEFIAIMGPSGSGKSTLLFALSGMDNINSGVVKFADLNLCQATERQLSQLRRTEMGFVFQQPTMLKNLNIIDNILLHSIRNKRNSIDITLKKARALMQSVGIAELGERHITEVSGGQLQRAGICRALINTPKIIFADEPTGALNSMSAEDIMNIFSEINDKGTAIMLVTHDAKVAARTERILFMRDGKLVSELQLPKYKGIDMDERIRKIALKMREIGI